MNTVICFVSHQILLHWRSECIFCCVSVRGPCSSGELILLSKPPKTTAGVNQTTNDPARRTTPTTKKLRNHLLRTSLSLKISTTLFVCLMVLSQREREFRDIWCDQTVNYFAITYLWTVRIRNYLNKQKKRGRCSRAHVKTHINFFYSDSYFLLRGIIETRRFYVDVP